MISLAGLTLIAGLTLMAGIILLNQSTISAKISNTTPKETNQSTSQPSQQKYTKQNKTKRQYRKVTSLLRRTPRKESGDVQMDFAIGRSFFINPWVIPPASTTARDGLGPLFNARTCQQCHQGGGRGRAPEAGEDMSRMLVRVSIPGKDKIKGSVPEPHYGSQFQFFGIQRGKNGLNSHTHDNTQPSAIGEARITTHYKTITGKYPDGQRYTLRQPSVQLHDLSYGPLAKDAMFSPRIGPSLSGMGLINEIKEADILALADPDDSNNDGISGRPNYVWSKEHKKNRLGRFGLKANMPTLKQQIADAFVNDIGITSTLFPDENCGPKQTACLKANHGRGPHTPHEISDELFDKVVTFVSHINVPQNYRAKKEGYDDHLKGKNDFLKIGCSTCHHPSFTTSAEARFDSFKSREISPYSDFLLHDMGKELADNRPDFEANGQEWRTAPLWGLAWRQDQGKFNNYLHDGRAKTIEEAILWHGGEAETAKQAFMQLPKERRETLIQFLKSL